MGVIGIVAAITMPTLIQNHKKKVAVTQLKATYSILSQALETSKNENGDIATWDFELNNIDFANKYVLPYLKIASTNNYYWAVKARMPNGGQYLAWPANENKMKENPIYILPNGSAIIIAHFLDLRIEAVIDINGLKGPNLLGIDGFVFYYNPNENKLTPLGYNLKRDELLGGTNSDYSCSKTLNIGNYYQGSWCASVIMQDGWEIKDDYPW